jgi:hypothetical protein
MSWREHLRNFVRPEGGLSDLYEFGVFTGNSMVELCEIYLSCRTPVRNFYGLDSFEGLPEETEEPAWQDCWNKGDFNTQDYYGLSSVEESMEIIKGLLAKAPQIHNELILVPGFYDATLNDDAVKKYDMKPALYVDMDMDIYSSAICVLEFMFKNELIVPGTIIGYDDWGGSKGWETMASGESRAHRETQEKYNVEYEVLYQNGNSFPHVAKVYRAVSIG